MSGWRNACIKGNEAMDIATVALHQVRNTKGFKHKEQLEEVIIPPHNEDAEAPIGKYTAQYSGDGKLVVIDVVTSTPHCEHRFWVTWPELRLFAYMIMKCEHSAERGSGTPNML